MAKPKVVYRSGVWTRENIAWAAGLFEGEGSIGYHRNKAGIQLQVTMTDRDVVERFGSIVGVGKLYGPYCYARNGKVNLPVWRWHVSAFPNVQALLVMFWPWLGARRRGKVISVLGVASKTPYGFTGREHTKETKAKMSEARISYLRDTATCEIFA